jgi:hypothetical protein
LIETARITRSFRRLCKFIVLVLVLVLDYENEDEDDSASGLAVAASICGFFTESLLRLDGPGKAQ